MDNQQEWARLLAALAGDGEPRGPAERHDLLQRGLQLVCTVASEAAGCSVTEATGDGFHTPANSNELALELDLVQYAAGDGPCVAACRDGRVHGITVMASEPDHPVFTEAALRLGVRSSLSLPLPGARRPAALNVYASNASAFDDPRSRAIAELLARCVARLLAESAVPEQPPSGTAFDEAIDRRRLMQRAVADVSAESSVDRAAAFDVLINRSRIEDRSIFAVARDVVAGAPDA